MKQRLETLKEMIRCRISYILPFGSLDMICIVRDSGYMDEISRVVCAENFTKANPNYVLCIFISHASESVAACKVDMLPPTAELHREKIYFLMPTSEEKAQSLPSTTSLKRREQI
ncbi:hypothetical protein KSP39_PZI019029 [Platanthera zijinensis]|uniref:Uncharacterized protein n=1 Tax=Platanthera zijinensis TaxID=2320716 RepID=A0AAP0B2H5_9ASPA